MFPSKMWTFWNVSYIKRSLYNGDPPAFISDRWQFDTMRYSNELYVDCLRLILASCFETANVQIRVQYNGSYLNYEQDTKELCG